MKNKQQKSGTADSHALASQCSISDSSAPSHLGASCPEPISRGKLAVGPSCGLWIVLDSVGRGSWLEFLENGEETKWWGKGDNVQEALCVPLQVGQPLIHSPSSPIPKVTEDLRFNTQFTLWTTWSRKNCPMAHAFICLGSNSS